MWGSAQYPNNNNNVVNFPFPRALTVNKVNLYHNAYIHHAKLPAILTIHHSWYRSYTIEVTYFD